MIRSGHACDRKRIRPLFRRRDALNEGIGSHAGESTTQSPRTRKRNLLVLHCAYRDRDLPTSIVPPIKTLELSLLLAISSLGALFSFSIL